VREKKKEKEQKSGQRRHRRKIYEKKRVDRGQTWLVVK